MSSQPQAFRVLQLGAPRPYGAQTNELAIDPNSLVTHQFQEGRPKVMQHSASTLALAVLSALILVACSQRQPVVSEVFTQSDAVGPPGQASARDVPFTEPAVSLPKPLIGLWAVSSDVCQSPHGEGWIRITENSMTGYEVALRPIEIRSVGESAWTIESEENYLGTQVSMVRQTLSLDGATLTVQPEGERLERYLRCGAAAQSSKQVASEYP